MGIDANQVGLCVLITAAACSSRPDPPAQALCAPEATGSSCIIVDVNIDDVLARAAETLLEDRPSEREPAVAAARAPLSADERKLVAELTAVAARYYPRHEPPRNESPELYEARYQRSPQLQRLRALVHERRANDQSWRGFVRDVKRALPKGFVVDMSTTPPFYPIPSHQIVITRVPDAAEPYRTMVFRLSHMVPYFDYYETLRRADHWRLELSLEPGDETRAVAALVEQRLAVHFPAYQKLAPHLCVVPVPELVPPNTMPENTTLAGLLFDEGYSW